MKSRFIAVFGAVIAVAAFTISPAGYSQALPVCQYAMSDIDGDGYGWENSTSCVVTAASEPMGSEQSLGCYDDDGDGWGWNGVEVCLVAAANCRDTDPVGDGWGWDGTDSCRITAYPAPFSEIEVLRANMRQFFGESVATVSIGCDINGVVEAIDLKSNGSAFNHFTTPRWSSWSTGLSDTDAIIWVTTTYPDGSLQTDKISLHPNLSIIDAGRNSGSCFWIR